MCVKIQSSFFVVAIKQKNIHYQCIFFQFSLFTIFCLSIICESPLCQCVTETFLYKSSCHLLTYRKINNAYRFKYTDYFLLLFFFYLKVCFTRFFVKYLKTASLHCNVFEKNILRLKVVFDLNLIEV